MKKSLLALTLLALPALTLSAAASAAEGLSYNYLEGGYVASNLQDSPDADGWGIAGSAAIAPNFHLFGNYSTQELEVADIDIDNWRLGVGYNHELGARTDLLARVAYERFETDFQDFNGYSVEVGVRGALTPQVRRLCAGRLRRRQRLRRRFLRPRRRASEVQPELGPERRRQVRRQRHAVLRRPALHLLSVGFQATLSDDTAVPATRPSLPASHPLSPA